MRTYSLHGRSAFPRDLPGGARNAPDFLLNRNPQPVHIAARSFTSWKHPSAPPAIERRGKSQRQVNGLLNTLARSPPNPLNYNLISLRHTRSVVVFLFF